MFSDPIQKSSRFPRTGLLMVAGSLVIVCQLVAMAMVADRQDQGAGVRDLQRVARQVALADCIRHSAGPARHGCIHQSQLESEGGDLAVAMPPSARTFSLQNDAIANQNVTTEPADTIHIGVAATR